MRRALDLLYDSAGWAAAVCMVLTLLAVLANIVDRFVPVGVRGLDAYAGYAMAGAGFLALAHTLKRGEHIRVTLLVNALRGGRRKALELWALGLATLLAVLFAFYSCRLVWQSHAFHDISTSNDATPLWIPQLAMALGTLVFALAFVDELVLELRGQRKPPAQTEASRNE